MKNSRTSRLDDRTIRQMTWQINWQDDRPSGQDDMTNWQDNRMSRQLRRHRKLRHQNIFDSDTAP